MPDLVFGRPEPNPPRVDGGLFTTPKNISAAISAYEKSLSYNSSQRRVRKELIQLYLGQPDTQQLAVEQIVELRRVEGMFEEFSR